MATMNTGNFSFDIQPNFIKWFGIAETDYEAEYDKMFSVEQFDMAIRRIVKSSGLGLPQMMGQNEAVSYDSARQRWKKDMECTKYATGVIITREAIDDLKSGIAVQMKARDLARVMLHKKELLAAAYLDNAFTDTTTGGDGTSLYGSHTTLAGTVSNKISVAAALSEASLEQSLIDIANFRNERGLRLKVLPRKVVVPVANMFEILRILNSVGQVYTPDNTPNALRIQGAFPEGHMVSHFVSNTTATHILTDVKDEGLIFGVRRDVEISSDNVFDTESAKFKAVMKVGVFHGDYLCAYGNNGV